MKRVNRLLKTAALALTLSVPALAAAGDIGPDVPPAVKGEQCVEPTPEMRRNHMSYLLQHRDRTMHEGIRTKKYSLMECLECHVPAEGESREARQDEEGHFCKNCHVYAGVNIDCFECHVTKPKQTAMFHPIVTPGMKAAKDAHGQPSTELLNQMAGADKNTAGADL